jgi:hypothetical protein
MQITKTVKWEVKKLNPATPITLRGSVRAGPAGRAASPPRPSSPPRLVTPAQLAMTPGAPLPDTTTLLLLAFNIPTFTASGLKVNKLDVFGDVKYKPFKGVKYNTVAGRYQIRC